MMISNIVNHVMDSWRASVSTGVPSFEGFDREKKVLIWITCAGFAGYLLVKGPLMSYMRTEFSKAYANVYLPGMDAMLHDFRSTIQAYLDDCKENGQSEEQLQLLEVGIGPGSSLEYYKDSTSYEAVLGRHLILTNRSTL